MESGDGFDFGGIDLWCVGQAVEPLQLRSFFNVAAEGSIDAKRRGYSCTNVIP